MQRWSCAAFCRLGIVGTDSFDFNWTSLCEWRAVCLSCTRASWCLKGLDLPFRVRSEAAEVCLGDRRLCFACAPPPTVNESG